jgi:hypothetical protein
LVWLLVLRHSGLEVKNPTAISEFDEYVKAPSILPWEDPLQWWKQHQQLYPRLAGLARKYLAVPASSVPSERIFSSAGHFDKRHRSQLDADGLEREVLLHHHFTELKRELPCPKTYIPTVILELSE